MDKTLEKFRADIDSIDDRILDLFIERAQIVKKVGNHKKSLGSNKCIIRPGREAVMVRRMSSKVEGVLSAAAIAQIWRLIISSSINIEEKTKVSTLALAGNRECYWLAREYFGSFSEINIRSLINEVFEDVVSGDATIGVLQVTDSDVRSPWWSRITEYQNPPVIFAKLPFVRVAPSKKSALFAIGQVDPEPTGEDESIWVIKSQDNMDLSQIEAGFALADIKATMLDQCHILGSPDQRHCIFQISGYVVPENKKIKKFLMIMGEKNAGAIIPVSAHYLGTYALPVYLPTIDSRL